MYVFDAYGTLLDVDAAAREAAAEPDMEALKDHWLSIAKGWRERQLRYSWLCSMMGRYDDFWELTSRALDATLDEHGLASEKKVRDRLLSLYGELSAYEEVPGLLADLKAAGHKLAVLSNASPNMLETASKAAGIYQYFDALLSVDTLKCYKPTPAVYGFVTEHFGCNPSEVSFFSSNNWDISGAGAFGFKTIWVNRSGAAWDRLPGFPDKIVNSIAEATKGETR
jgi:2-haloacid dehalogenase